MPTQNTDLRGTVLGIIQSHPKGISISDLEKQLQQSDVEFARTDLRALIWSLASVQQIQIDEYSKLLPKPKSPAPQRLGEA